jgi:hypothetical protein
MGLGSSKNSGAQKINTNVSSESIEVGRDEDQPFCDLYDRVCSSIEIHPSIYPMLLLITPFHYKSFWEKI